MAKLGNRFGRGVVSTLVAGGVLAAAVYGNDPRAAAEPDPITKAKNELAKIEEEASAIDAKYSQLQEQLDAANKKLAQADKDLAAGQKTVGGLKSSISQLALVNMQSAGTDVATQLLTSPDDTSFLNYLATQQSVSSRANDQLQRYQLAQASLAQASTAAKDARNQIATSKTAQAQLVADYDKKEAQAKAILAKLTEEQRRKLAAQQAADARARAARLAAAQQGTSRSASRSATGTTASASTGQQTPTTNVPASGRAGVAVSFALAQVGKPYVWGATGPGAYDCSGLMLRAWAQAGVSLPRTSQAQYGVGTPVSLSNLQPGDLVFFYSGISHVAMYIGNGKIVHASNPRTGVKISDLSYMPAAGARRVG